MTLRKQENTIRAEHNHPIREVVGIFHASSHLQAAAAVAGGLIGTLLAHVVGHHHANYLQEQIEKGGLLLWVHARDPNHAERSIAILRSHCGDNAHVHETAMAG